MINTLNINGILKVKLNFYITIKNERNYVKKYISTIKDYKIGSNSGMLLAGINTGTEKGQNTEHWNTEHFAT